MNERPILFSGPMVRAILDGRKTQTRRVLTARHFRAARGCAWSDWKDVGVVRKGTGGEIGAYVAAWPGVSIGEVVCPYGAPGDRLWVRETWRADDYEPADTIYLADIPLDMLKHRDLVTWKPSIHMPRVRCRLRLELTTVRVQRLQEITQQDTLAEGVYTWAESDPLAYRQYMKRVWNEINGPRGYPWDSNPWVWAITFRSGETGVGQRE